MAKFRSKVNYAQIFAGDKQGYNLGLDGAIFVRQEATPRVFNVPRVGTQGKSTSAAAPSTDISLGPDTSLNVNLSGRGAVLVALVLAGLTTGPAIAAELETKTNAAYAALGYDERCWVEFAGGLYVIWNQSTGVTATVVVTNAAALNVADELKLGIANGGVEVAGTNDQDCLLYTTGGPTFNQPVETNTHRNGRFHGGIIRQKKIAEFDIDAFINMSGTAGASIDTAVALMWEAVCGKKTVAAGSFIDFEQDYPAVYMSMVRVSTIFGEYYNGAYTKNMDLAFPGEGPATTKWTGKAADAAIAGIATVNGVVAASTSIILDAGMTERYTVGAYIMAVDTDGRTILAGADGSLKVDAYNDLTETLTTNVAVTLPDNSYIVPWHPGAVQQTTRDNIYTDLVGTMKLRAAGTVIDVTEITLSIANDHVDLDNRFGADANKGFVAGNRLTATLGVTFDLSNETMGEVVRTRDFGGFTPEIVLGATSGRHLKITGQRWIPSVPTIEVPENGTTPVTLEGVLYESAPGARDPFKFRFG